MEKKKRIFSALKPTGKLTIGNYIGALKNMVNMQGDFECFYSIADLHSITVDISPAELRKNCMDMLALFIACGLDPDKSVIFVQSHVPKHAELAWVLSCFTMMGEASRMTQFKDKSQKNQNTNVGLFSYPILMAADILLYQADLVPVGSDQKQHVELTRVISQRFNNKYSPTFTVPEGFFPKYGARIYSLLDPTSKMGKTDENTNGTIYLLDDKDTIMRKFKRAVTDSGQEIKFSEDKPGISNLITIYSAFASQTIEQTEQRFAGFSYADFKMAVGEIVADKLMKIQAEYNRIISDKQYLSDLMKTGAQKADYIAQKTLSKVYKKVGFLGRV